jgi:transposase-like protein
MHPDRNVTSAYAPTLKCAIEALNRQLRKAIKTKGHFSNEEAARKLIYLAIVNAVPAWTPTRNWTTALLAFNIHFGDRLPE